MQLFNEQWQQQGQGGARTQQAAEGRDHSTTVGTTYKDNAFLNLQVVVGESLNRSILIAKCEYLYLLYLSGSMN